MNAAVVALIYIGAGHSAAFAAMPLAIAFKERWRSFAIWAGSAAIYFLVHDPALVLIMIASLWLGLSQVPPAYRYALYVNAMACLPAFIVADIPFPGLNHLLTANTYKVASAVILLPAFVLTSEDDRPGPSMTSGDWSLLAFLGYACVIVIISLNFTSGLRFLSDMMLLVVLPYFFVRRFIRTSDDVETCLRGILIASLMLAAVTLVSTAKQWDMYRFLAPPGTATEPDTRSGFIRIEATANTHSLAFHLAAGLLILQTLKNSLQITRLKLNGLRAVLLAGMYFTDSRGAALGLIIAGAIYLLLTTGSPMLRRVMGLAVVAGVIAAGLWLVLADPSNVDQHNTFSYRQELLRVGLRYLADHPIFGRFDFYTDPRFEPLRQGQGIIDITNLYLQVALHYGLFGFVLFFWVFVRALTTCAATVLRHLKSTTIREKYAGLTDEEIADDEEKQIAGPDWQWLKTASCLVGLLSGWIALVMTTSDVALTLHIGMMLAVLLNVVSLLPQNRPEQPIDSMEAFSEAGMAASAELSPGAR